MYQNGVLAKETKADIAEHVFSLSVESAFEDLSLHSFLKASDWDFEEKNDFNKHRIWLI